MNDEPNLPGASDSDTPQPERLGPLARGLAHDLNNILVPTLGAAHLLRERLRNDPTALELVEQIHENAKRGADIMERLMTLANAGSPEHVSLDPAQLLADVAQLAHQTFPVQITVEGKSGAELRRIRGAAPRLFEVLMNLCFNARDAMPSGGKLVLSAENFDADAAFTAQQPDVREGKYVVFTVADTGFGIGPQVRSKLFTPGFTTKAGKHAGLGLSNALSIVRAHGGFITVRSEPGWGATLCVHLPACDSTEPANDDDLDATPPSGLGESVLLVDDEPSVRATCKAALEQFGYRPLLAGDGDSALASFAENGSDIRAVITDLSMPMLGGATVVSAVKRMKPGVKVIVASGFLDDDRRAELRALGCDAFLSKPYTIGRLLRALHDTLRG